MAVECKDINDIIALATVHRQSAMNCVDRNVEHISTEGMSEEERAEIYRRGDDLIETGRLRFIYYVPTEKLTNVVLTLSDNDGSPLEWNLSMSHARLGGPPDRVDDELAELIVKAYLGEGY